MKRNKLFNNALFYLICMVVACVLNLAVNGLLKKIVNLLIVVGYFEGSIVGIVSSLLTCGAIFGAVSFLEGRKSLEFAPLSTTGAMLLAGVAHLLLCALLMFTPFIAGGVRALAGILQMGDNFNSKSMIEDIYLWTYLIAYGLHLAYEIAVCLLFGWLGKWKRLHDRKTLHSPKEDASAET